MTVNPWSTDKVDLGYLPTYQAIANEFRARGLNADGRNLGPMVLEIGVAGGAGMAMLRDLFDTERVAGVDMLPHAGTDSDRARGLILVASQDDAGLPLIVESTWGRWDLIVDDCSHLAGPTSVTLANMWRLVNEGGYYVIEDWNHLEGPGNGQNLWQKVFGHWLSLPQRLAGGLEPYSGVLDRVESVTVRSGLIVIKKGEPGKYPGER